MFRPFLQPSRCPNPPPELRQEAGCSQGWCRGITGPITLSEGWWESSSNSLEPGSHFLSKWGYVNTIHHSQGFWAGSRHGCSPTESPGMNSPEWPPSPASLSGDFSPAGMEGRFNFRNQVSSQPWTPGNQTPHHLPHLMPKSYSRSEGIRTCEKPSCFFQIWFRAEQDARMNEMECLQRKLTSKGVEGMSRLWSYLAQRNTLFLKNTELAVLKQTMWHPWQQSAVTDMCNPTVHMTDTCVSLNPEDTWGHTPPGLQIFPGKGLQADSTAAGYHSSHLRPASCE